MADSDFIRDDEFYMTLVTFKVKDVHFRVPIDAFLTRSEVFRDMFALPVEAELGSPEGSSDEAPIVLEGVEVAEFKALLRFLYPKDPGSVAKLTQAEWIGIHALAHMWGFEEARKASKAFLVDMEDSIAKLEVAVRYEYDDWLRKAYEELAKRPDPLSIDEVTRIGMQPAFHIAQIREERLKALSCLRVLHAEVRMFGKNKHETYCPHCSSAVKYSHTGEHICYTCGPCGLTFYRSKQPINERVDKRIRESILRHLPLKIVETCKEDDEKEKADCVYECLAEAASPQSNDGFVDFGD